MTNTLIFRPFSLKDIFSIRKLYLSAFPDNERMPLFWLLLSIWQDEHKHLQIVEHQGRFVGFAYVIKCPSCLLLGYLATTSQSRSQGYGKQILSTSEMLNQNDIEHAFGEFIGVPFWIGKR